MAVDEWAVTFGTTRRGLGGAAGAFNPQTYSPDSSQDNFHPHLNYSPGC